MSCDEVRLNFPLYPLRNPGDILYRLFELLHIEYPCFYLMPYK